MVKQQTAEPINRPRITTWARIARAFDLSPQTFKRIVARDPNGPLANLVFLDQGTGNPFVYEDDVAQYKANCPKYFEAGCTTRRMAIRGSRRQRRVAPS